MTKSNILLAICLVFIGGVFVVSVFQFPKSVWDFLFFRYGENHIKHFNDTDKPIIILGQIVKEPDKRDSNAQLIIAVKNVEVDSRQKEVSGKILATSRRYPEYRYGDELKITGRLKTPTEFEDFNYPGYLAKDGLYSVMYYPKIEPIGNNYGNFFYKAIFSFKDRTKHAIEKLMPLPEVSILEALALGNKRSLTENLKNQLNITGTRHIVAISGMHILILSQILIYLLIGLGLRRGQVFYFVLALLILFIIMVGAPASAVRAGIMSGLLLFAQKIGRLNNGARTIVFAGTLMLALNPLLLKFDVGFQLSFLAVLGIIYLKPIFDELLNRLLPEKLKNWLDKGQIRQQIPAVIAMTLAAQTATLPILVYNFGRISFISPLANVLIVPALPYVMGAGFIFSLASVIWLPLGKILVWPIWFFFTYVTRFVEWFSKIPFAAKEIQNVHWAWLLGYYILLVGFLIWYKKQKSRQILQIVP